jgi:hypothetical protein
MGEVSAVRPAREKLHIVLFVIGLILLVSGVAVAVVGPDVMVKWHPRSGVLLENAIIEVRGAGGRDTYPWQYPIEIEISRAAADIRIEGNITEIDGHRFYFVAIDGAHHSPFWDFGGDTTGAYVDIRNVTECSFAFNLTREQLYGQVRFGVENRNNHEIWTRLSAMIYWKDKEVVEPTFATIGLFTIAKLAAVVGLILIIAAAVLKVRKLEERPYRAPN